jgi:hypothetical protein
MENAISINELEKRMRPMAYSDLGFIGINESLEAILQSDESRLQKLGISHEQISGKLKNILADALNQRRKICETNYQEFSEREKYDSTLWRRKPAPIFSLDKLPDIKIGYLIESKYQVFFLQFFGFQECPWNCEYDTWSSFIILLLNREIAQCIQMPGLIVHLIREHHFFEGVESPYRVDPFKLAQILEFIPSE